MGRNYAYFPVSIISIIDRIVSKTRPIPFYYYILQRWLTYKKKILNKSVIQIYDHICYSKSSCLSGNDLYKKSERMKEMCRKLGYFANPVFGFSNEENTFLSIKTSRLAKWHIKVPYPKTSKLKEFRMCVSIFSSVLTTVS